MTAQYYSSLLKHKPDTMSLEAYATHVAITQAQEQIEDVRWGEWTTLTPDGFPLDDWQSQDDDLDEKIHAVEAERAALVKAYAPELLAGLRAAQAQNEAAA